MKLLLKIPFLMTALLVGLGLFMAGRAMAQTYTFGSQIQSTNTASLTYGSGNGLFQYTDASNSSGDTASIPLTGSAATLITSSSGWHASISVNISTKMMTATSDESPNDGVGLSVVYLKDDIEYYVSIVTGQVNNTGDAGLDFPDSVYGTGAHFLARINELNQDTTPLGASQLVSGDSILVITETSNAVAATESVGAVAGVVTLGYDASTKIVTGYFNGVPIGNYSIAGWAANPSLTLYVFGSSGEGVDIPAGSDTATNFNASSEAFSLPQLAAIRSGSNFVVLWPTNATGFTLQSTTNLVSPMVWTTVSPASFIAGANNAVTNIIAGSGIFFRLQQN
jgi:hypothetical protein